MKDKKSMKEAIDKLSNIISLILVIANCIEFLIASLMECAPLQLCVLVQYIAIITVYIIVDCFISKMFKKKENAVPDEE